MLPMLAPGAAAIAVEQMWDRLTLTLAPTLTLTLAPTRTLTLTLTLTPIRTLTLTLRTPSTGGHFGEK